MADIRSAELELKPNWWPSPQDYNEAIQELRVNAQDPALRLGLVHCNALGLPRALTGSFASVYKVHANGGDWAVRCFLRDISDQQERYAHISRFVQNDSLDYTVTFDFLREGIRLNGRWFPILKMDWVDGLNLDLYIEQHLGTSKIPLLAASFKKMCEDLQKAGIAHGDMQHGNIIVHGDELRLVDYDGMFVPAMAGMLSNEIGHRNYQHPGREARHFGANLDNFSAWVIYVSLLCISIDPDLYGQLGGGDECLLFRRDDFLEPEHSYAFGLLEEHSNVEVRVLAKFLRWQLKLSPDEVPPLLDTIPQVPQLPPVLIDMELSSTAPLSDENTGGGRLPDWISKEELNAAKVRALRRPRAVPPRAVQPQPPRPSFLGPVEPELQQPLPRFVRFNPNCGRVNPYDMQTLMLLSLGWMVFAPLLNPGLWGFAVISLLAIFLLNIWIWNKPTRDKNLARTGYATITSNLQTSFHADNESGAFYKAKFDIEISGKQIFRCERAISADEFRWLEGRQSATVLFNPAYPEANMLYVSSVYKAEAVSIPVTVEDELKTSLPRQAEYKKLSSRIDPKDVQILILLSPTFLGALFGGFWIVVCLFLTMLFEWMLWKQHPFEKKLVCEGVPASARITSAYFNQNSTVGELGSFIEYAFESYDGRTINCKRRMKSTEIAEFPEGQVFTVLYDIDSPKDKNMIYKLSRYRVKI